MNFFKYVSLQSLNVIDSNYIQTGSFSLIKSKTSLYITFSKPFNSTPKVITSLTYLDTYNQQSELNFNILISNLSINGFQVALSVSQLSNNYQANYTYIATTASNIFQFSNSYTISISDKTTNSNYNVYTKNISYSKSSLLQNPSMKVIVVGFMTGFYVDYTYSSYLSVSFQINQQNNNLNNFAIIAKEDLNASKSLMEVRFNYFEFYYQENSSLMMKVYQDQAYEFITSTSNCLYNNLVQSNYLNNVSSVCKIGLCCDDLNLKFSRVQTTSTPINVMHQKKLDFQIGYSKLYFDLNAENGRLIINDYFFAAQNNNIGMFITYFTWQGTRVLGVTSTIVEYYSLSCLNGYFYSFAVKDCVKACESQTYPEQNLQDSSLLPTCNKCDSTCLECQGPLSTNCKSCSKSFPFFLVQQNSCSALQPSTNYICQQSPDVNLPYQQNCQTCDSTCLTCSGVLSTNCLSCTSSFPYFHRDTNECLSSPKTNQYCQKNSTIPAYQMNCQQCYQSCLTCSGLLSNNCLTCPSNLPFFNTNTNECLVSSPSSDGYYCQQSSGGSPSYQQNCYLCNSNCLQCYGPLSTNCLSCSTALPFLNLQNNSCLAQAPSQGFFCKQSSNVNLSYQQDCQPCDPTCLTCSGNLPINCLSCSSSSPYFNIQTNQCLQNIPGPNFYCQSNQNNPSYQLNCNICDTNCLTCSGPLSNNCLTCPIFLPYLNASTNECLSQAPFQGYFCENSTTPQPSYQQNCYQCDPSCLNCNGPLTTDCLSCSLSYPYFNTYTNTCLAQKPYPGFICKQSSYNSPSYQQDCFPCDDNNCIECTDTTPKTCVQCQPNSYLFNKECQLIKPNPAYCDSQNNCQACEIEFCLSCDNGPQTCSLCPPSFYIDQFSFQCKCPYASYLDINTAQCLACPKNCVLCQSNTICQLCESNSQFDYQQRGTCILKCQPGQFYNRTTQSCQKCSPTCLTCLGSQDNCLSCKTGALILFNSILMTNECSCIDSQDILNKITGLCQKCPDSLCQKCDDNNRNVCLQCISSAEYSQVDQQCKCIQSTYYSLTSNSCDSCPQSNCQICQPDGSKCIQCKSGYFYDSLVQQCSYCKQGKYSDSENKCTQNCLEQCEYCSDSISCFKYYSNAVFYGSQCHFSCSKCSGDKNNQCLECSSSTRTLDLQTNTCTCKSEFVESNESDCQFNPSPSLLFQIAGIVTNIQYFIYLPTVFINHHPFSDYFLMNSQLIGNHFYSKQPDLVGIFACYNAKFNYLNLLDNQVLLFNNRIPKNKDQSNIQHLIVFLGYAFLSYISAFIGFLIFKILDKKQIISPENDKKQMIKHFLNWNIFIKANRISSNMILIYSINNLDIFQQINAFSACILAYGVFYLLFLMLQIYVIKVVPSKQQFKYLLENLNCHSKNSLMFWLIAEIKKIILCFSFLLNENYYLWVQFSIYCLSFILSLVSKPYNKKRRDQIYVFVSDILSIIFLSIVIVNSQVHQYNDTLMDLIQNKQTNIQILLICQIFLAALHSLIIIEYAYRIYLKVSGKQLQQSLLIKQNNSLFQSNKCFVFEQKIKDEGISVTQIQNILNMHTISIQLSKKRTTKSQFSFN